MQRATLQDHAAAPCKTPSSLPPMLCNRARQLATGGHHRVGAPACTAALFVPKAHGDAHVLFGAGGRRAEGAQRHLPCT